MPLFNKQVPVAIATMFITLSLHGQKLGRENSFLIEGRITHFGSGFLVGTIVNAESNSVILDTIFIKNDIFYHKGRIANKQVIRYFAGEEKFSRYRKVLKDGDSVLIDFLNKRLKAVEVVAYPGAEINVEGVASAYCEAYPSGDADNEMIATLDRKRYPVFYELSNLDYSDKKNFRKILQKEEVLSDSIASIENSFIKNNPSSVVSSYIMLEKFQELNKRSFEQADSLLSQLQPQEDDIYYQNMLLIQRNRSKVNRLSVGDVFPDFQTRFVYKDSIFNLSQTKGKYRLIDFWGTWCLPCVREMPRLKQFYEKHKDKLVLIGVANNDTYQNWKAYLDKNTYKWVQLLDQEPNKLSEKIKVEVYPTKYLLDPFGRIIMIIKDADQEAWNKMEGLIAAY